MRYSFNSSGEIGEESNMNHNEALKIFIRNHLRQLTDRSANRQSIKILRQQFFERNKLPAASRFSNNEVAIELVKTMITNRKLKSRDEIESLVNEIPILHEEIHQSQLDILYESIRLGNESILTTEDLRKIQQEEYLVKISDSFQQKAVLDAQEKLEDERKELDRMKSMFEEEKKTFEAQKSALDSLPAEINADEMITQETISDDSEPVVWWKNLGLEGDPFINNKGLFGIPTEKYEDVVVQTPFVKSYLNRIRESPEDLLDKTIILLGGWGSGKTTIFQITGHIAGKSGFLPILVWITPVHNLDKYSSQLVSQITSTICSSYPLRIQLEQSRMNLGYDEIGHCINAMQIALRSSKTKGFLIFIDGLHKTSTYLRESLEFIQQIQNIQERIISNGIKCGIIVAGDLDWETETEFKFNPTLSGSHFSVEKIPPLSEDAAVEAVIRRINSFLPAGAPRPTIEISRFRQAFRIQSTRLFRTPTFRDFLDHVKKRLTAGEFSEMGISISLHTEVVEFVRLEILKTSLADGYVELSRKEGHSESFRKVIRKILPMIYLNGKNGITESDLLFKYNIGAFFLLRKGGFITPHRSSSRLELAWFLSPELINFLENLRERNNMMPQDILSALFSDPIKTISKETESYYGDLKKILREMSATWRSGWPEISTILEITVKRLSKIEKTCEVTEKNSLIEVLENVKLSMKDLIRSILFALGDTKAISNDNIEKFFDCWCTPEDIDAYRSILELNKLPLDNISEYYGILHKHSQIISDLSSLLNDIIKGESIARLVGRTLTEDEISGIHDARTLFNSVRYFETVNRVAELLDKKIKDILFVALRCFKGEGYLSILPPDIGQDPSESGVPNLPRGHRRTIRNKDANFLYDISRSEYSKIIFKKDIRRMCHIDSIDDSDIAQFKSSWEVLFSLADRTAHYDRPEYFRRHSTEIAYMLQWTPRLCEMLNNLLIFLLTSPEYKYERTGQNKITLRFGAATEYVTHHIDQLEVEAIVKELLNFISLNEPVSFPPIERFVTAFNYSPEKVIGLLRAANGEGLLTINQSNDPFYFSISLTSKGRDRLGKLKGDK
jgi:hypothetical protein